jgi:hypothetical protein
MLSIILAASEACGEKKKSVRKAKKLSVGELNPGLPRDRRGYSPLY